MHNPEFKDTPPTPVSFETDDFMDSMKRCSFQKTTAVKQPLVVQEVKKTSVVHKVIKIGREGLLKHFS